MQAFVTLYATDVGHRAYEYSEKNQGYFTYALVEGLKGKAANGRGEVTLGGLIRYLEKSVPDYVERDLPGKVQRPFAVREGYKVDELVIAVSANKPAIQPTDNAVGDRSAGRDVVRPATPLEAVLNKYVDGLGGRDAIERLTTRVTKGTIENPSQGLSGSFEYYEKAPNKSMIVINYPGIGSISEGYNGKAGWSRNNAGVQDIAGLDLVQKRRDSDFYRDLKLGELHADLSLKDRVKLGERDVNLIEATTAEGGGEKWYFDVQTGLRARRDYLDAKPENNRQRYYEDYREVDGIKWPFIMRDVSASGSVTYKYEQVKFNAALEDEIFNKPAAGSPEPSIYERATSLANEGKWVEAEAAYREMVRLQPRYALAHYGLGVALLAEKKFPAAEIELREAVRLSPNNPMMGLFHFGLAEALRSQQRSAEAEREYAQAAVYATRHYIAGMSLLVQDRFAEAEIKFREAIRLGPNNPTIGKFHFELGEALEKQQKLAEAEREYAEAVRLNPSDEDFRKRLDGIRKPQAPAEAPAKSPAFGRRPYSKETLISALRLNALPQQEIIDHIKGRGVDFQLTPEVESQLRGAGATPEVIEAVRKGYEVNNLATAGSANKPATQPADNSRPEEATLKRAELLPRQLGRFERYHLGSIKFGGVPPYNQQYANYKGPNESDLNVAADEFSSSAVAEGRLRYLIEHDTKYFGRDFVTVRRIPISGGGELIVMQFRRYARGSETVYWLNGKTLFSFVAPGALGLAEESARAYVGVK